MIRVLRLTIHPIGDSPVTTVMLESDVIDTLESIRHHMTSEFPSLVTSDIFEMPDGTDIGAATIEAVNRMDEQAETHMEVLYMWTLMQWRGMAPKGILLAPKPAPLTRDQVTLVLRQLANHPAYNNDRTVVIIANDLTVVTLRGGNVLYE